MTTNGRSERPEWSPDGKRVLYRFATTVAWQAADHSVGEQTLARFVGINLLEGALSPKGDYLLMRVNGQNLFQDVAYMRVGDTTLIPFIQSPFAEFGARFSPDGRWVAYSADQQPVFVYNWKGELRRQAAGRP